MPMAWQEFKFGQASKKLTPMLSRSAPEAQFIYVDDVLDAFKIHNVEGFEANGGFETDDGVTVSYMRDDSGTVYCPKRILFAPERVIKVVYEIPTSDSASLAPTIVHGSNKYIAQLGAKTEIEMNPYEPHQFDLSRKSTNHIQEDIEVLKNAMIARNRAGEALDVHSIVEEVLSPAYHKGATVRYGFERKVIHMLDSLYNQGDMTQKIAKEVLKLSEEMKARLVLIQKKTEAILTQQLELAEYPIPRLFIVLPEEAVKYDPSNLFRARFRLHFICECDKHTEPSPSDSKIRHHLHIAKHEGYLIREPTAFFKKYGPFIFLMLELIKFGISITGYAVPTLASLKVEKIDFVQQTVESITARIDYSLEYINTQLSNAQASPPGDLTNTNEPQATTVMQQDLANYLNNVEGLEGVELRQLRSFLKTSAEDNLLRNLYRITTAEGHVKWVCRDHYRAGYLEVHTQELRDLVNLTGGAI